jgi:hypothetical protein
MINLRHRLDLAAVHQSVNGGIRKAGDFEEPLNRNGYQIGLCCSGHTREQHGRHWIATVDLRMTTA